MDALILCGGQGTRLRGYIPDGLPKCMVPIGNKSFIEILLEHMLQYEGIRRFTFCTGYQAELVEHHIKRIMEANDLGAAIEFYFSREPFPMGTGGCLISAARFVGRDPFFVFNGDTIHKFHPFEMFSALDDEHNGIAYVADPGGEYCGSFLFTKKFLSEVCKMTPPFSLEDAIENIGGIRDLVSPEPYWDIGSPARLEFFRAVRREVS